MWKPTTATTPDRSSTNSPSASGRRDRVYAVEPVGVAIASIPKARCQMDGLTLEINRCCADPRYADVCSNLYARTIRIGREMGYTRFLTYTLPEESGSSLRAVGFQVDGVVHSPSGGWNAPSRPRSTRRYPSGDKVRWVLHTP